FGGPGSPHCAEEIKCAVLFKASRLAVIWCRKLGRADQSNATAPATCGVAIDVPLKFAYELSLALVDERVPVPGAEMSGLVAIIGDHRPAAAKRSNGVAISDQRSYRVGCRVNSGRILHGGTIRPGFLRRDYHHNTGSSLRF